MENKMTCPKCGFEQTPRLENGGQRAECLRCGIVFAKFDAAHGSRPEPAVTRNTGLSKEKELLNSFDLWTSRAGKFSIIGIMALFFFYMVIKRSSWCFLDYVNLPFHEFGHILFSPFGETIQFLGGTISQLMWPLILMVYFLVKKERLAAAFCLFWFGENFLNISKYIADARRMALPLVGGGIHDWNFLLGKWHALKNDLAISKAVFAMGVVIMTVSMVMAFFAAPKKEEENSF